jgi:lysophospholipase L1-like esterase
MASRFRRLLGPAVLVTASVVTTLVLLEGALRVLVPWLPGPLQLAVQATPGNFGRAHDYIGHLHRPNLRAVVAGVDFRAVHDTDARGFRNQGPWPERADVVAIGDSLTYGYGVDADDAWPSILQRALAAPVVNLGLIGAGPQQYRRVYEVFGAPLSPKLVLVGVFPENDFQDAGFFDTWLRSGVGGNYMVWRDTGRRDPSRTGPSARVRATVAGAYAIARRSYLFNLVDAARRSRARRDEVVYTFPDGGSLHLTPRGFDKRTAGAVSGRPAYRLAIDALRALADEAGRSGTRVVMVLQPSKEEIHLPLLGIPARDPAESLRRAFAESRIDYIDLLPVFRDRARRGQRLFFQEDNHPNRDGYRLIAETVLQYLASRSPGGGGLARD